MTLQEVKQNLFTELINKYGNRENKISPDIVNKEVQNISLADVKEHYEKALKKISPTPNFLENFILSTNQVLSFKNSLNVDFVVEINNSNLIKSIFAEEEETGVKSFKELDSAVRGTIETKDYYEDELTVYSVCWFRLINNHPFKNGNKRTAFISVKSTLIADMLHNLLIGLSFNFSIKRNKKLDEMSNVELIKKAESKIYNEISQKYSESKKKFLNQQRSKIANIWSNSKNSIIGEDYILSMWIVNNSELKQDNEKREEIYKIIRNNLLFFLYWNRIPILQSMNQFHKSFWESTEIKKEISEIISKEWKKDKIN